MSRTAGAVVVVATSLAACSSGGGQPYAADAEGNDTSTFACASPQDCFAHFVAGPQVFCCIHNACIEGQAAEAQTCSDPAAQNIMASSYDQSCQTDSDCIAVEEGNFCDPGADNGCTNAAINKSALPQWRQALGSAAVCGARHKRRFSTIASSTMGKRQRKKVRGSP